MAVSQAMRGALRSGQRPGIRDVIGLAAEPQAMRFALAGVRDQGSGARDVIGMEAEPPSDYDNSSFRIPNSAFDTTTNSDAKRSRIPQV